MSTALKYDPLKLKRDPGYFARAMGGMRGRMEPTAQQDELFDAVAEGYRKIVLRACRGPGKTTGIALLGLWYMSVHRACKIIYTSTKAAQLRHQVWAEMNILQGRSHPWIKKGIKIDVIKAYRVDNPEGAVALAEVAPKGTPESQAGWHHLNLLIIVDESSGVDDSAIDALEGCLTNPGNMLIMVGNPTRLSGRFFDAFHSLRAKYKTLHFDGFNSPLVSDEFIQDVADKYGVEGNIYRVQVLGEFPLSDDNSLILLEWVEAAVARSGMVTEEPVIIGVDPARSTDGDATGMVARQGGRVLATRQKWVKDLNQVQGYAKQFRDEIMAAMPELEWGYFAVETDGLGAGVYDGLNGQNEKATPVCMAGSPVNRYRGPGDVQPANLRADLWLCTMDFIKNQGGSLRGLVDTPELDILMSELSGPRSKPDSQGRLLIEAKADMKKRGLKSPNLADALCLTFAEKPGAGQWVVTV